MREYGIAIVGAGPRCTYALERIAALVSKARPLVALRVSVFEASGRFGAGDTHSDRQPTTSYLNRVVGQIAFAADESNLDASTLLPRPLRQTFTEWCRAKYAETGNESFALSSQDVPKRYLHGLALSEMFTRYVTVLRESGVVVDLCATEVIDVALEPQKEQPFRIYTAGSSPFSIRAPLKAACDGVWRDLRAVFSEALDHGGVHPDSHRQFVSTYLRYYNRLSNGAGIEAMKKVLALVECGLLDVSVGPQPRVEPNSDSSSFRVTGRETGVERDVDVVVDGKTHPFNSELDVRPLYQNLVSRGLIRKWKNPGYSTNGEYFPGGLDLSRDFHPVQQDGSVDERLTFLGSPVDRVVFFQLAAARPNSSSDILKKVASWAREALESVLPTGGCTASECTPRPLRPKIENGAEQAPSVKDVRRYIRRILECEARAESGRHVVVLAIDGMPEGHAPPSPETLFQRIRRAIFQTLDTHGSSSPCLVWCFIETDRHIHHYGYDEHVLQSLELIEKLALDLVSRDIITVAHSDHGLVRTVHEPEIEAAIERLTVEHRFQVGGAGRTRWIYPAIGTEHRVREDLARALPGSIRVSGADERFSAHCPARERVGSILLIAEGQEFVAPRGYRFDHGSLTETELRVPFSEWRS